MPPGSLSLSTSTMQLLYRSLVAALLARQALGNGHPVAVVVLPSVLQDTSGAHILAASGCDPGWTICNNGCMPVGDVCCAQYVFPTHRSVLSLPAEPMQRSLLTKAQKRLL